MYLLGTSTFGPGKLGPLLNETRNTFEENSDHFYALTHIIYSYLKLVRIFFKSGPKCISKVVRVYVYSIC